MNKTLEQQIQGDLAQVDAQPLQGERDVYQQDTQHTALLDAILLLAEHVQRLDELVAIQWQKDVCANDYSLPNDVLDELWVRRNELRKAIWDETPLRLEDGIQQPPEQADEEGAGPYKLHVDVAALRGHGVSSNEDLNAANERIWELEAQLAKANAAYQAMYADWLERNDVIGKMGGRIRELEDGVAKANELIELYKAQRDENDQETQECTDVCLALEAKEKHLEAEVSRLAERLAERDADAEVGRAIREFGEHNTGRWA